jgi:hypothetical protein
MIYITGDTHGDIDFLKLKVYFSKRYTTYADVLLILGDAGIIWSQEENYISLYENLMMTVIFIDGNHENFDMLKRFPIVEKFGAKMHRITGTIFHVIRGELLTINGLSFLTLGGASSVDKWCRTEGVNWWKEENIGRDEFTNAVRNLRKAGGKVDYLLTHTAPTSLVTRAIGYKPDDNTDYLERLYQEASFSRWYFGHFHIDRKFGPRFRCFYQDILEIPVMDKGNGKAKDFFYRTCEGDERPFLWGHLGRLTKMTIGDLPEWYFCDFEYCYRFYSLKGVKDVAFFPSPFDNHINKDSRIILSYSGKLNKDKDLKMKDKKFDKETWRAPIANFVLGLEKYSPSLNLKALKARINLVYDQYNNRDELMLSPSCADTPKRPFPEIRTPQAKDYKYVVTQNGKILSAFRELANAKQYITTYIKNNYPKLSVYGTTIGNEDSDFIECYDTGHNENEWIYLSKH